MSILVLNARTRTDTRNEIISRYFHVIYFKYDFDETRDLGRPLCGESNPGFKFSFNSLVFIPKGFTLVKSDP